MSRKPDMANTPAISSTPFWCVLTHIVGNGCTRRIEPKGHRMIFVPHWRIWAATPTSHIYVLTVLTRIGGALVVLALEHLHPEHFSSPSGAASGQANGLSLAEAGGAPSTSERTHYARGRSKSSALQVKPELPQCKTPQQTQH